MRRLIWVGAGVALSIIVVRKVNTARASLESRAGEASPLAMLAVGAARVVDEARAIVGEIGQTAREHEKQLRAEFLPDAEAVDAARRLGPGRGQQSPRELAAAHGGEPDAELYEFF